jgi:HAD superfamily hydrolase (TIGR01450 family)
VLRSTVKPLSEAYDVALLDLDGVVYIGPDAVPDAPGHLARATEAGMHLAFVTNNAARPPATVADHLRELGVPARPEDVVTSAQAAARMLAERLPQGAKVFVIGGTGLEEALRERGLVPVQDLDDEPVAVVSGYHPDVRWKTLSNGAILVRRGLPWVASNTDLTVPTPAGPGLGNGALVEVVARFSQRDPEVAGKPQPPLFEETMRRVGGSHPLVVGDRLDTDIEGAVNTGYDSLLVMTGVTDLRTLLAAGPGSRPSYVGADLSALAEPQPEVEVDGSTARAGDWTATVEDGALVVEGEGSAHDWWRAAAVAGWRHLDATGDPATGDEAVPPSSVAP